jgi:hypothetical protein
VSCAHLSALADSITYRGVQFKVDSREDITESTVKVVIGKKPILLPRNGVERGVVLRYLAEPELLALVPVLDLRQIVSKALVEGDTELAAQGVVAALSSRSMSAEAYEDFLTGIMALERGGSVVSRALQFISLDVREQALCVTLSQVGIDSLARFGEMLRRSSFGDMCSALLIDRSAALLQQGQVSQSARHLRAVVNLVAGNNSRQTEVVQSYNQLILLVQGINKRSPVETIAGLERLRRDKLFSQVSASAISGIIMKGSEQWLAEGDAAGALYLLSHTDPISRTPVHHNLVLKGIEMLPAQQFSVVVQDPVKGGLRLYASKDEGVRAALVRYISGAVDQLAVSKSEEDTQGAAALLSLLDLFRPDSPELNDAIRGRCAAALMASGRGAAANLVMKQMITGVPISLRFETFVRSGFVAAVVTSLAAILVLCAAARSVRLAVARRNANRRRIAGNLQHQQVSEEPSFVAYPAETRMSPVRSEYELLLKEFDLSPQASPHEIKMAYREKVKAVHPDRNVLTGEGQSDDFIELTAKYDRLLELLEQQGRGE